MGGIYDFLQKKNIDRLDALHTPAQAVKNDVPAEEAPSEGRLSYEERKARARQRRKLEKEVEEREQAVMTLESEKADVEAQLATPEGASDTSLFARYGEVTTALQKAEDAWAQALEALEAFGED